VINSPSTHPRAWKLLLAVGAFLMFGAGLLVVTSRNIINSSRFGANVAASLGDERVAAYVADQLTDAITAKQPDLLAIRPILLSSVRSIAETPHTFHTPEDFNCRPNRGGATNSLFQINHWIETTPAPRPSNAAIVNAYDFLLARARTCERERRQLPNIIGVDFAGIGDLLRVARTLNGLDSAVVNR
jgi:hypothetical protein